MHVGDIFLGLLSTLEALSPVSLSSSEAIHVFRERQKSGVRTFVAASPFGGVSGVVGTASLLTERKFIRDGRRVGHIEDVAVHPGYQGRGIGPKLVRHLVDLCVAENCYKVLLDCGQRNVAFYEKLGFRPHAVCMRLDLK